MTLKEYIEAGHTTIAQIGDAIGYSEHGVRKLVYRTREPDLETALKIERFTHGAVPIADMAVTGKRGRNQAVAA